MTESILYIFKTNTVIVQSHSVLFIFSGMAILLMLALYVLEQEISSFVSCSGILDCRILVPSVVINPTKFPIVPP
jgi:hypothetical protein